MSKNMSYKDVRKVVYKRYSGKCAICGKPLELDEMHIDLIIPKSKGGNKFFENMQCACASCTNMKHDLTQDEFFKKLLKVTLHNLGNIVKAYVKGGAV